MTAGSPQSPPLPAALEGLQPAALWRFFGELSAIPRPSKHEEQVLAWLKDFADRRGLAWQQDAVGNVVIKRAGSGGGEGAPAVIIQGHVDMVTEKNADTVHDFMRDPLKLRRDGDWVSAEGTTLGSEWHAQLNHRHCRPSAPSAYFKLKHSPKPANTRCR